ncbi:MAG: ABC transporter permease [Acidobacteriota bacterium]|nr:ABC transporter permease [Blastocatellia bacterium]MDW8239291.1 ABC transporter permease [Acidobacteriota bacterium]
MNKIFTIARREFLVTITRPGYIVMVIGMPLFFVVISAIGYWTGTAAEANLTRVDHPIAVVDRANILDLSLADTLPPEPPPSNRLFDKYVPDPTVQFVAYESVDRALDDLKQERLSACYVIEADYLASGQITAYALAGGFLQESGTPGQTQLHRLLRASLVKPHLAGDSFARVLYPSRLNEMKVSKQGEIRPARGAFEEMADLLGPFAMFMLMTLAIFFSSGYLLQGIAEEKQNRVIEVLLSSAKPTQLLAGKILGLGAAGLLQVTFYIALIFVPAMSWFVTMQINTEKLLLSVVYFILGYLLFACLLAATGVIGNTVQESSQLSAIWTMTSMIPMFLLAPISTEPNGVLARVFSFFPLTTPVTMMLRISAGDVPVVDIVSSVVVLLASIYLAVKGAAKVFRASSLMYGKRPSLPEIIRWLREA